MNVVVAWTVKNHSIVSKGNCVETTLLETVMAPEKKFWGASAARVATLNDVKEF